MEKKRMGTFLCAALCLCGAVLPWIFGMGATERSVEADGDMILREDLKDPPLIALTFDDGPSSVTTPVLLDGLAERGIKATFFLVGSMAADNHATVRRMAQEGHQLGVHTYDHSLQRGLTGLNEAQFRGQVDTTRDLISALTGQTEFVFRPPYGFVDASVKMWADSPVILWSIDPEDWKYQDAEKVAQHIISHAEDGAIILLHDIFKTSVEGALEAVDALLKEGYRFVTVDQLFEARGITAEKGTVYHSLPG